MSFSHLSASSISMSESASASIDNCIKHVRWRSGRCAAFKEEVLEKWEEKIDLQTCACTSASSSILILLAYSFTFECITTSPHTRLSHVEFAILSSLNIHILWDIKRKFQFRIHITFFSVVFHVAVQIHSIVTSRCLFCGIKIIFTWIKKKSAK